MIRIGSSTTGVSSKFNSFHSVSSVATGFFTNASDTTPRPEYRIIVANDLFQGLDSGSFSGRTIYPGIPPYVSVGDVVSTLYLSFVRTGTRIEASYTSGYSGRVGFVDEFQGKQVILGDSMLDGSTTYVRFPTVLPSPHTLSLNLSRSVIYIVDSATVTVTVSFDNTYLSPAPGLTYVIAFPISIGNNPTRFGPAEVSSTKFSFLGTAGIWNPGNKFNVPDGNIAMFYYFGSD